MDQNTENFINDTEFRILYEKLHKTHKPRKASFSGESLEAIGLVIVKFQRLESTAQNLMGFLLNIENRQNITAILASKMSFGNLFLVIQALSKEVRFHRQPELDIIISKALKAEEIRNQIVHSLWAANVRIKTKITEKKGLIHQMEEYTSADLKLIATQIDQIDTSLSAIKFDYLMYLSTTGIQVKGIKIIGDT